MTSPNRLARRSLLARAALVATLAAGSVIAAGTAAASTADDGPFAVVATAYGDVEIPSKPERIVVLSLDYLEAVLALGVEPVASPTYPMGAWVTDILPADSPVFSLPIGELEINIEAIANLEPDVIFGSVYAINEEAFDTLSAIAPTVALGDSAEGTVAGAWENITTQVGTALGLDDEATAVIEGVHAQIADFATAHPDTAGKAIVLVGVPGDGTIVVTLPGAHSGLKMLAAAGFDTIALSSTEGDVYGGGRVQLSFEQIGQLDEADVVLLGAFNAEALAGLQDNALYQNLDVVQQGRTIELALPDVWATNSPTALNIGPVLDLIGSTLTADAAAS